MKRILVAITIFFASVIWLLGISETFFRLIKFLGWLISLIPAPPTQTVWQRFAMALTAQDWLVTRILGWLLAILFLAGLFVPLLIFWRRTNGLIWAKYWCYATLIAVILFVVLIFVSAIWEFGFQAEAAAFLSQRIVNVMTVIIQAFLIGIAARILDMELNRAGGA
jgi:hypothetical protein